MPPMTKNRNLPQSLPTQRMFRVDAQDGPWSVSVADTPNDAQSYTLYIKTPTHNLTLTRTAFEVVELDEKLRDCHPGVKLPKLPLDLSSLPAPPKRKSAFLNTLSRLASPSAKSSATKTVNFGKSSISAAPTATSKSISLNGPSTITSPIASPSQELNDPFGPIMDQVETFNMASPNNATITGLAAYLTSIANDQIHRQTRAWKRFVRVRTDDLESVRVERAIKRVRSDLAAHMAHSSTDLSLPPASELSREDGDTVIVSTDEERVQSEDEDEEQKLDTVKPQESMATVASEENETVKEAEIDEAATSQTEPKPPAPIDTSGVVNEVEEEVGSTPVQADASSSHTARIPRSQSADPTSRARVYKPSPLNRQEETMSQTSQTTGDESSVSMSTRRSARKKRSQSADPNRELKKRSARKVVIDDFEMMRVLGKGCAGKVLLVRHKPTTDLFALKAITKRHVLAHQELQHTLTEQAVLKRMAAEGKDPFVVKLWWSFHDRENLFLVMDFHPGGDLATQLARWGRLGRDRARFYAAEIVEGVEGLHANGVIYRDLKPENVLIGSDGHIVLTDFGLSKEFPRKTSSITAPPTPNGQRSDYFAGASASSWTKDKGQELANGWPSGQIETTSTFCGTAEYLAPEVIQGLPYSFEVDWWSFGTMLYEMLTGITPFWANNHSDMYLRVLQDELQFPEDRSMDQDTKSLIRGLLQRNPALRIKEPRIKRHPYFSMIDWSHVYYKRYIPPYIPPIDPSNASDTQNFDETFLDMEPVIKDDNENDNDHTDTDQEQQTDTDRTEGEDSVPTPSQSRSPSVHAQDDDIDVFDGYSFKGRNPIVLDDDEDTSEYGDEEDEDEEEDSSIMKDSQLSSDEVKEEDSVAGEVEDDSPLAVDDIAGPKTPEARLVMLPVEPLSELAAETEEQPPAVPPKQLSSETTRPVSREKDTVQTSSEPLKMPESPELPVPSKGPTQRLGGAKAGNRRREKSGIAALDRHLGDAVDQSATEREEDDDDDWDFVEAGVDEERNGAKATSLFARGVVDRYKLAVFRKSTPSRHTTRTASGMSNTPSTVASEAIESPSPSEKQARGRTPGLSFRKQKPFSKTPPSSFSSKASMSSKQKSSNFSSSTRTSSSGFTRSSTAASTLSPSLKSKQSAVSMTSPSESSDQSMNGDTTRPAVLGGENVASGRTKTSQVAHINEQKVKKKKYKGSEIQKVLSIFASPR